MMQNHTGHVSMDPEIQALRINMQDRICKWLERKQTNPSSYWNQRLLDIAKRLEETIFKESLNKDDYIRKFQSGIESRLVNMLYQMKQNQERQQQLQQQNHQQTMAYHNMMQNHTCHVSMDPEIQVLRINMQDRICKWLERKRTNPSSYWKQILLPHIAKRLEETIFKESLDKDDYIRKFQSGIESRLLNMLYQMKQNQEQQQQLQQQNHQQTMAHHNMQSVPMNQMLSSQEFGDGMMDNNNELGLLVNSMQQLMIPDSTSNPTNN
ncbi:p300/CBP acetyltransferase-related protein-like protein [Carex rostrata]